MDLSDDEGELAVAAADASWAAGLCGTPPSTGRGGAAEPDFEARRDAWNESRKASGPSESRQLFRRSMSLTGRDGFRGHILICGWRQDMVSWIEMELGLYGRNSAGVLGV